MKRKVRSQSSFGTQPRNIMDSERPSRSVSTVRPVARSCDHNGATNAATNTISEEEKRQFVYVPDFRLAFPDKLAADILKIKAPLKLIISIPVDTFPSTLEPGRNFMTLKKEEVEISWRIDTAFESKESDTPDTTIGSQVEGVESPPMSQSIL